MSVIEWNILFAISLTFQDFRVHISQATEYAGKAVIPNEVLNKILEHLPQLQNFNEDLLKDFQNRIANW